MTISITEQIRSQQLSEKQGTRLYICNTTAGETSDTVKTYIRSQVPSMWANKRLKDIQVNPTDAGDLFFIRVDYGKGSSSPTPSNPLLQTSSMSFQYHSERFSFLLF